MQIIRLAEETVKVFKRTVLDSHGSKSKIPIPEKAEKQPPAKKKKQREKKPLEAYSAQERDRIAMWCRIIKEWLDTRAAYGKRSEADPLFVAKCKLEHPELEISVDILYRKYAAYKQDDYDGSGTDRKIKRTAPGDHSSEAVLCLFSFSECILPQLQ